MSIAAVLAGLGAAVLAWSCVGAAVAAENPPGEAPRALDARDWGIGELVDDAAFTDVEGKAGSLGDWRGKTLVVAMSSVGCPVSKRYAPRLVELAEEFGKRGVQFLLVDPSQADSVESLRDAGKQRGFTSQLVLDKDGAISRALGARSTGDVFILDSARTLVWRGPVDDQYGVGYTLEKPRREHLREALGAVLEGRFPKDPAVSAPGCAINSKAASKIAGHVVTPVSPTWHGRVARIVQRNCQECHRLGENGPFPLLTLDDVRGNAEMIKFVVQQGTMPPWFAAEGVGGTVAGGTVAGETGDHPFANDRSLSPRDKADLLAWIAAECPEGDPKDAPLPVKWTEGWKIGQPDLVVEVAREIPVKATGTMQYQFVAAYPKVEEDRWIAAMEVLPSQPEVVHHILVFLRYPRTDPRFTPPDPIGEGLEGFFAAMVPGQGVIEYPAGMARLLPKGATLLFQIHYQPNGTATVDRPRIGFRFAKGPPEHEVRTQGIYDVKFRIPPGAPHHPVTAQWQFPQRGRILGFMCHTHLRGKSFKFELTPAGKDPVVVLDVPKYDFNWQLSYMLRTPIEVEAGAKLRATAWYDNSAANPANPDPGKTVRFGDQTSDEMMIGYFDWIALPAKSK